MGFKPVKLLGLFLIVLFLSCSKDQILDNVVEEEVKYENQRNQINTRGGGDFREDLKVYFSENGKGANKVKKKWGSIVWDHVVFISDGTNGNLAIIPINSPENNHIEALIVAFQENKGEKIFAKSIEREKVMRLKKKEDLTKNNNGKYEEFYLEFALGNLLVFDTELYGSADCDLVAILKEGGNLRNIQTREYCLVEHTLVEECQQIIVGDNSYTDCTYDVVDEVIACEEEGDDGANTPTDPTDTGNPNGGTNDNHICTGNLCDFPKIDCIYQKLSAAGLFKSLMENFVGSSRIDLEFNIVEQVYINGQPKDAKTYQEEGTTSNLVIDISKSVLDRGVMFMALTLLHEGAHAEIKRIILENATFPIDDITDSNQIWDDYMNYEYSYPTNTDHEYMINEYTSKLGDALYQFAKSHLDPEDISFNKSWYNDFAYYGLTNTKTWKQELNSSEKNEISEGLNQIYYNYNPQTIDCQ